MAKKRYTPEEIVAKLRQVDVLVSQGRNVADAIRQIGVSEVTYYRWRQEYGGLKTEQVKRLKELETENARLRRAVSDLTLDKLILREAARGNFFSIRITQRSVQSRHLSSQAVPGKTATSRASTRACAMNCSTAKSSTRCARPRSSSKVGGATSIQSGRMDRSATNRQHLRCSSRHSPRGRLRYVDQLRWPRSRWRNGQL